MREMAINSTPFDCIFIYQRSKGRWTHIHTLCAHHSKNQRAIINHHLISAELSLVRTCLNGTKASLSVFQVRVIKLLEFLDNDVNKNQGGRELASTIKAVGHVLHRSNSDIDLTCVRIICMIKTFQTRRHDAQKYQRPDHPVFCMRYIDV